jgi:hypothetical protein
MNVLLVSSAKKSTKVQFEIFLQILLSAPKCETKSF